MDDVASQFLRALRGTRSQVAFARRLGYRANPIASWEAGRHFPSGGEALRACARLGIDVSGAFARFGVSGRVPPPTSLDDAALAVWLDTLRRPLSTHELAGRCGASRYQVGRWLAGRSRPRLPDFFALVEAATGRLSVLLAQLVPLASLPALAPPERMRETLHQLHRAEPWVMPVFCALATRAWIESAEPLGAGWLAARFGISEEEVERCLGGLAAGGVVVWERGRWLGVGPVAVETKDPASQFLERKFWADVVALRVTEEHPEDHGGECLVAVSEAGWQQMREVIARCWRELWAIGVETGPADVVGLVHMHAIRWIGPEPGAR